jgi:hypothetical protein
MTDILERLCKPVDESAYKPQLIIWEMCNQRRAAAEEIGRLRAALDDKTRHFNIVDAMWRHAEEEVERLRAALGDIAKLYDGSCRDNTYDMAAIARRALEGKVERA